MNNLRPLILCWVLITLWLVYEYVAIGFDFTWPQALPILVCLFYGEKCGKALSLEAGEPVSYILGWIGFFLIVCTNFYIAKKRLQSGNQGVDLKAWLNWHIFFGLTGSTFIFFHTGGSIEGLAAVGFWSMMCSFISGIIGRFLYIRMLQAESSLRGEIKQIETRIARLADESEGALLPEHLKYVYRKVFRTALGRDPQQLKGVGQVSILSWGVLGEWKLLFWSPSLKYDHPLLRKFFCRWGLLHIRLRCLPSYRKIFSHWHSFHAPFAVIMYTTVAVHIASSFIFQAN
ncbi:MAG: hypothetical protein AB8C84_12975 [Oligoflexales bacterium]